MPKRHYLKIQHGSVGLYHYYHPELYYSLPNVSKNRKMTGVKRVIVFCILIVILPATLIIIPLYLRKTVFADVTYPVAESDIIEIRDGISSIFCQKHSLRMSTHFNAFQLRGRPEISTNRKHIRLKKSMTLPDDTLEYWGFYLLKGAKVHLKFCSRYDGSRILVVKGQRELKTCGLLDHNKNKVGANFAQGHEQVKVFFEDITEITEYTATEIVDSLKATEEASKLEFRDKDLFMELENNGGEDMSENNLERLELNLNNSELSRTKQLREKSNDSHRRKKTEDTTLRNSLKTISDEKSLKNRQRRHNILNTPVALEQTFEERKVVMDTSRISESRLKLAPNTARSHRRQQDDQFLLKHKTTHERLQKQVYYQLYENRPKREHVYDRKYSHGGNAVNFTGSDESNSISSFENGLLECYNGDILLAEGFPPSADCLNAHFLENGSHRMLSEHKVTEDGYYYYIFYSDNDLVTNDIHAIFDIYKPTFQYSNLSDSRGCVNATNCTFPVSFLSDEIVLVEIPTRDGIEHEEDDITHLISTCHPRMGIYAIFPITVLLLILSCSFL